MAIGKGEWVMRQMETAQGVMERLTDPRTAALIRRAIERDVVLDTWMCGELEETVDEEAEEVLSHSAAALAALAEADGALFPGVTMPSGYTQALFHELLSSMALYQAQKRKGVREVDGPLAREAVGILRGFAQEAEGGLTDVASCYFVLSAHEDLNAIHYYQRMKREDFLLGHLHRPWSHMVLTNQMGQYLQTGLIRIIFSGDGEMLELTGPGREALQRLQRILTDAGEFEWRSNAQRWVIFNETNYDIVFNTVIPDVARVTRDYIESLEIPPGAAVLEIGAGTGRATVELGLADRVREAGGTLTALEPSASLMQTLRAKCQDRGLAHVRLVQGAAEDLPFADRSFDVVLSVGVLPFTDLERTAAEMVRVTKPGGLVTSAFGGKGDVMAIPMVARWFRPLHSLAASLQVPPGERQGVAVEAVETAFRAVGLTQVVSLTSQIRVVASDYRKFLQFFVRGGAFFQNILSRLPYQERQQIVQLLERTGEELAASTTAEEQQALWPVGSLYGRAPATGDRIPADR